MISNHTTRMAFLRNAMLSTAFAAPMLITASAAFAQAGDKATTPTTTPAPMAAPMTPTAPMTAAPRAPAAATPGKPMAAADREMSTKEMGERVEAHIKTLHTQLKITPAQQPQWDAFAQVMRDNAGAMRTRFDQRGTKLTAMNAADNMQSYALVAEQHAQDMQKLATSFSTLYATMSPEQKTTADTVFRGQHDRMGKGRS
jgi:hypothetical protein